MKSIVHNDMILKFYDWYYDDDKKKRRTIIKSIVHNEVKHAKYAANMEDTLNTNIYVNAK